MGVRIGINPLTWTNDDIPELGAEIPLEVCLSEGKQAGYEGFELGNKFPRGAETLRPLLQSHGLDLVSGWHSAELLTRTPREEIEALQDHLNLLKAMGCQVMVFAEVTDCVYRDRQVPLSRQPRLRAIDWGDFGARLNELGEYLSGEGIRMAYHHHMGTVVETEDEIDLLMRHTNEAVGLLLDTGHLTYASGDPCAVIRRHGERIVHVHCKDVRPTVLEWARTTDRSFLDAVLEGVFTVPGDGCVNFDAVVTGLKKAEYRGWLVVEAEQDPAKAHPLTYATNGYRYLSEIVTGTGI